MHSYIHMYICLQFSVLTFFHFHVSACQKVLIHILCVFGCCFFFVFLTELNVSLTYLEIVCVCMFDIVSVYVKFVYVCVCVWARVKLGSV